MKIDANTSWKEVTPGGDIYEAGNSREFKTGDWRSIKPIWIQEKCTQCGLCFPVCPDDSIPVKGQKRADYDYDMCKGCGVCAQVCPFKAIEMEDE
ncbi:MAG: 4Fe-4S binding protein [Firmicutes bacterium]|nr:4Fe-4S binding protein [Bacillota bacterium]